MMNEKDIYAFFEDMDTLKDCGRNIGINECAGIDPQKYEKFSDEALAIISKYSGEDRVQAIKAYHSGYYEARHAWIHGGHLKYSIDPQTNRMTDKKVVKIAESTEAKRFRIIVVY